MFGGMLALRQSYQILRSIISTVAIDVMHVLRGLKNSTISLIPDKAMFWDIASTISKTVLWAIDKPITILISFASTLPALSLLPTRVVSMDVSKRVSAEVSISSAGQSRDGRWLAAATLTQARLIDLFRHWNKSFWHGSLVLSVVKQAIISHPFTSMEVLL